MTLKSETIGDAVLYLGDSLELLHELPTASVDAVVTDPPYSSGGAFRGDRMMGTKAKYVQNDSGSQNLAEFTGDNRDQRAFAYWSALWASEALRCTRPGGIALFFTDWRQLPVSTDYLQAGGWIWRGLVPWVKTFYRPQLGRFGAQCEYAVWGSAGPLPLERGVGCLPGFYECASPSDREHITQKPDELMAALLRIVHPGAVVLDPFMGSGTTGVAAVKLGQRFIGCEQSPTHFATACRRLEEAHRSRELLEPRRTTDADQQLGLLGDGDDHQDFPPACATPPAGLVDEGAAS